MKSILRATAALLLAFSLTAKASSNSHEVKETPVALPIESFVGAWEGLGYLKDMRDQGLPCEFIRFQFEKTESALVLKEGVYNCSGFNFEWNEMSLSIEEGLVTANDKVLGEISDQGFKIDLGLLVPDVVWTLEVRRNDKGQLVVDETQSTTEYEMHSHGVLVPAE